MEHEIPYAIACHESEAPVATVVSEVLPSLVPSKDIYLSDCCGLTHRYQLKGHLLNWIFDAEHFCFQYLCKNAAIDYLVSWISRKFAFITLEHSRHIVRSIPFGPSGIADLSVHKNYILVTLTGDDDEGHKLVLFSLGDSETESKASFTRGCTEQGCTTNKQSFCSIF